MTVPLQRINFAYSPTNLTMFEHAGVEFKHRGYHVFQTDVRVSYDVDKLVTNFDVAYIEKNVDSSKEIQFLIDIAKHVNDKIIHLTERHDKIAQCAIMNSIEKGVTPKTWSFFKKGIRERHIDKSVKFVLKAGRGARGIGQVVFDSNDLSAQDVISTVSTCDYSELKEKLESKGCIISPVESDETHLTSSVLKSSNHLQELVENIRSEYRILAHKNFTNPSEPHIHYIERKISEHAYPQARGTSDNKIPILYDNSRLVVKRSVLHPYIVNVISKLLEISPLISVDVYETTDNKQGIFEYCNEFAMEHIDSEWRQTFMRDVIISFIEG